MRVGAVVLACGALARELLAIRRINGWDETWRVQCLPADLHNRPERIVPRLRECIDAVLDAEPERPVLIGYADCGTGGGIDRLVGEYRARGFAVERLPGAHCYEFFAGSEAFAAIADDEPGTFYLTDFLTRHFDRLVWAGLGLDRHPSLRAVYFGHYRRVVYLAQTDDERLLSAARAAAERLALAFEWRPTGYGPLSRTLCLLNESLES